MSERLSGQDAAFLAFEAPGRPMHVGALAVLEARGEDDVERLRAELVQRLGSVPRFRQRLVRGWRPRWEEDPHAAPDQHVHVEPVSGSARSDAFLDRVSSRFAPALAENRALWEAWIFPGLDDGAHIGVLLKAHHAMVDGTSGLAVLGRLLSPDPEAEAPPRPARRGRRPASERSGGALRGLLDLIRQLLRPSSASSLNGPPAETREIATLRLDEARLREAADAADASVNDVLLAIVGRGARRFLGVREDRPLRLRAFCPTDARPSGDTSLGNRLGAWIVDLPTAANGSQGELGAAAAATARARERGQSRGVELLGRLSDRLPAFFPRIGMALAGRLRAFNLVVTHVRGPEKRLLLAGLRLQTLHALAPVFPNQRCSIAAFRYAGGIHLALTGAWPTRGECRRFAAALEAAATESLAASARPATQAPHEDAAAPALPAESAPALRHSTG